MLTLTCIQIYFGPTIATIFLFHYSIIICYLSDTI